MSSLSTIFIRIPSSNLNLVGAFTELEYGLNIYSVVCILLAMSLLRVQHTVKYSRDQFLKGSKVLIELGGAQV